ncbi:hypothetical protein HDC37_003078 [Microbacterium sp. AK009]|nr:hypothetical protein [Microbacterium sp. AK009]
MNAHGRADTADVDLGIRALAAAVSARAVNLIR